MKLAAVLLVALTVVAACGGDDDGSGGKGEGGASAGTGGSGNPGDKTLTCGAKTCRLPATSLDEPCCRDEFASECGAMVGNMCRKLRAQSDKRCPLPDLPGIADASVPDFGAHLASMLALTWSSLDSSHRRSWNSSAPRSGLFAPRHVNYESLIRVGFRERKRFGA